MVDPEQVETDAELIAYQEARIEQLERQVDTLQAELHAAREAMNAPDGAYPN